MQNHTQKPTESYMLGYTDKSMIDIYNFTVASKFKKEDYRLINNNCQHFANELSIFTTGAELSFTYSKLTRKNLWFNIGGQVKSFLYPILKRRLQVIDWR